MTTIWEVSHIKMPSVFIKGMWNNAFDFEMCCRCIRDKDEEPDDSESNARDRPPSQ